MKQLRKKIVWYFIACAFALEVAVSVEDSFFEAFIAPHFKAVSEGGKEALAFGGFAASLVVFFLTMAGLFMLSAFVFFRLVKKAVQQESDRQAEEQRLMYASLAHDLKTPFTSVIGFSSSLIDGKIPPERQEEILRTIHDKAVQTNSLLETMLAYSKLNSESFELHREKTDFCAFVRRLAAAAYDDFESHGIDVSADIPEHPVFAMIDGAELSRALMNLLANVWVHNPAGTRALIRVQEEKNTVRVRVADSGARIDPQKAETLFNPFVSGNEARTSGKSSGLGLAIARAAVERHGGRLYIDSGDSGFSKTFVMEIATCKEK